MSLIKTNLFCKEVDLRKAVQEDKNYQSIELTMYFGIVSVPDPKWRFFLAGLYPDIYFYSKSTLRVHQFTRLCAQVRGSGFILYLEWLPLIPQCLVYRLILDAGQICSIAVMWDRLFEEGFQENYLTSNNWQWKRSTPFYTADFLSYRSEVRNCEEKETRLSNQGENLFISMISKF